MMLLRTTVAVLGLCAASAQAATHFAATIDAAQIVGGSTSTGTGRATATLSGGPGSWVFSYVAEFEGYDWGAYMAPFIETGSSPASGSASTTALTAELGDDVRSFHIHVGDVGGTGPLTYSVRQPSYELGEMPILEILGPTTARISGQWNLADGNFNANAPANTQVGNLAYWGQVMADAQPGDAIGLYFDIHTNAYPGSAIRGQIMAVPEPQSIALMLAGLAVLGVVARRR